MQSLGGINLRDTFSEFMKTTFTEFVARNITWKQEKEKKLRFRESAISVAFYGNYYIFFVVFYRIVRLR